MEYIPSDYSFKNSVQALHESEHEDEDDEIEEEGIKWINIICLPFQNWWQCIMLVAIIINTFMSATMVFSHHMNCSENVFTGYPLLVSLRKLDLYVGDYIILIDLLLSIIYRQVADEAMKSEHPPRSALIIVVNILAVLPLFNLFAEDVCMKISLWPHILHLQRLLLLYRIPSFFEFKRSHNYLMLTIGYVLMFVLIAHGLGCLFVLLSKHGLCARCSNTTGFYYDWRQLRVNILNRGNIDDFELDYFGTNYLITHFFHTSKSKHPPATYAEMVIDMCVLLSGYVIINFFVKSKIFGEVTMRYRNIFKFHPRVLRIVEETQRRNPSADAHKSVEKYYSLIWEKQNGLIHMPKLVQKIPRCMFIDLKLDLSWALFYHSPTFRRTSSLYKHYFCQSIRVTFRQPGEKFFFGPHCYTNLYYLKSGIVQLISRDDSTSPVLSVASGTIFGDINFFIPPLNRKINARCLTYCVVCQISRADILRALHKFPHDRQVVMLSVQERLKHARDVYKYKENIKGEDKTDDEDFAWIKRRWWQISTTIYEWKMTAKKTKKCQLPPEEHSYHCSKFIGQLVLCDETQLNTESNFMKMAFPWVLNPHSDFTKLWHWIVIATTYLVLFIFPPLIVKSILDTPKWFTYFSNAVDCIYVTDVLVSIVTAVETEGLVITNIWSIANFNFKNTNFIIGVLSTPLIDIVLSNAANFEVGKLNRLFKIYILLNDQYVNKHWTRKCDPTKRLFYEIALAYFAYNYIVSYILHIALTYQLNIQTHYFVNLYCTNNTITHCNPSITEMYGILTIFIGHLTNPLVTSKCVAEQCNERNVFLGLFLSETMKLMNTIVCVYLNIKYITSIYMTLRVKMNYQSFVSTLTNHYKRLMIHPDLLIRLQTYLNCHWKYYNGIDILQPYLLKNEPSDIYYKLHGDVAEKIISESLAFKGADRSMIKELARKGKFLILPKNSTLLMFGVQVENVTWLVRGVAKSEYNDEKGDTVKLFIQEGSVLSMTSVLLNRASLRTYTSVTDVEILYVKVEDFFFTIRRYHTEWECLQKSIEEFGPVFDELFVAYVKKHRQYQKKLREKIFHARQSISAVSVNEKKMASFMDKIKIPPYFKNFRRDPESKFIMHWLTFRVVTIIIHDFLELIQGSVFEDWTAEKIKDMILFFKFIACIDIFLKLFIPYYDKRGLIISGFRKCAFRYLTRGFIVDLVAIVIDNDILNYILALEKSYFTLVLVDLMKLGNLYLVIGWFNYHADKPSRNSILLLIVNWHIVLGFMTILASTLLSYFCLKDVYYKQEESQRKCWLPYHFNYMFTKEREKHNEDSFLIFLKSFDTIMNIYIQRITGSNIYIGTVYSRVLISLYTTASILYWLLTNFFITLLILYYRGDKIFEHEVEMLNEFLKSERVERETIDRCINYFIYWWKRTEGVNVKILMNERIGLIFRQDLNYFFFKRTIQAMDTILKGGEAIQRLLASCASEMYFLPGEDIMREMHLTPNIFIVHRGKVIITRNGVKLQILTKGSIFGQLDGKLVRPVYVTAQAVDRTDVLVIPLENFQSIINDDIKYTISRNTQSALDYMVVKKTVPENPYNSLEYILRETKSIKLPNMTTAITSENKWYARWLFLVWVIGPVASATIVLFLISLPQVFPEYTISILIVFDVLHLTHFITDFYSMKLEVKDEQCVLKYQWRKKFLRPWLYLDLISFVVPFVTIITRDWNYQAARLLRIFTLHFYDKQFCRTFEGKTISKVLKFVCVILVLHLLVCGWIIIVCREPLDEYQVKNFILLPEILYNKTDETAWMYKYQRPQGCIRLSRTFEVNGKVKYTFLVPTDWAADYLISWFNIVINITKMDYDYTMTLTLRQVCYELFVKCTLYFLTLWFTSRIISTLYSRMSEMYHYDYKARNLNNYLKVNAVSKYLRSSLAFYLKTLWEKQQKNWLPDIAEHAPLCLREDMFTSLYMHHLLSPPMFQSLPSYFLMQLAEKLTRVVIYPGKFIVQAGDINSCMYFIHEGVVEQWHTDHSGKTRVYSVLTINGYFGILQGLFPDVPYFYSYYSRTIVDLVCLKYENYQNLVNAYPDIKSELLKKAAKMKMDFKSSSKISNISMSRNAQK